MLVFAFRCPIFLLFHSPCTYLILCVSCECERHPVKQHLPKTQEVLSSFFFLGNWSGWNTFNHCNSILWTDIYWPVDKTQSNTEINKNLHANHSSPEHRKWGFMHNALEHMNKIFRIKTWMGKKKEIKIMIMDNCATYIIHHVLFILDGLQKYVTRFLGYCPDFTYYVGSA